MYTTILIIVLPIVFVIILLMLLKICYINGKSCKFSPNLTGKIAIITGSYKLKHKKKI